ncbi:MAG TPA: protein-export chaperone SecB [Rhizomicrobium sp.]|jgi:preprotein translocase subunit SecB
MSAIGNPESGGVPGGTPPMDGQPRVQAVAQYIKDLSFENPSVLQAQNGRPAIDLGVDLQARRVDAQHYEVVLKLRVSATVEQKALFMLELAYAGMFQIVNVPEDVIQQILLIECPHLIFPFARRIVADTVRDGSLPPLMIEPIDFAALYRAKQAEMQQAAGTTPPTTN